jgi:hypothetical protein
VVEHHTARLVHLGIRQARYFGRTKTLFQACLRDAPAKSCDMVDVLLWWAPTAKVGVK